VSQSTLRLVLQKMTACARGGGAKRKKQTIQCGVTAWINCNRAWQRRDYVRAEDAETTLAKASGVVQCAASPATR
jgi:hypothetical protein